MLDKDQTSPQQDEIVLTVRYSGLMFWLGQAYLVLGACGMLACVFPLIQRGEYLQVFFVVFAGLVCLHSAAIHSLAKHLLFCQDRVVQVWHFLGQKTIFYPMARVETAPAYLRWLQRGFCIKDVNDDGRLLSQLVRISYKPWFVHPVTAKKIAKIIDYLTEDSESNPRLVKKARLPKEII